MHLLVSINNNIQEWCDTLSPRTDKPMLPLPYAFGGAFVRRGHKLSAVNVSTTMPSSEESLYPFEAVYPVKELLRAIKDVDLVSLWGGLGLSAIMRQFLLAPFRRRVVLNSYVWQMDSSPTLRSRKSVIATQVAARFARAVVVMTAEQAEMAGTALSGKVPVIFLRCGIDTAFYRVPSSFADVPENYREVVGKLLAKPYMILPGDELRFNRDALDVVTNTGIPMVRISQYSREDMLNMQEEIRRRGIEDRFFIFERISYPFMRFLLQNAAVYAGLVNSEWQPAGWTVLCEALASGLPVVAYEGLATREMVRLGANSDFFRSVPMNDIRAFQEAAQSIFNKAGREEISKRAQSFAAEVLDFEHTAGDFVTAIERLL